MKERSGRFRCEEYRARINRTLDYIENHLAEELTLQTVAAVSGFSSFHFHRIFHAFCGETLSRFIRRVRLEKAATQLLDNPRKSVTDIAFDCGFSGSAAFSRAFHDYFEISPSRWRGAFRSKNCKISGKISKKLRNSRKDIPMYSVYADVLKQQWRITMKNKKDVKVEVKELPAMPVAYVRHTGPYKGDDRLFERLFSRLCQWAGPRGLIRPPLTKFICVYHDHPEITEKEKLRVSVCLTVPENTMVDGEIGKMTIVGGRYAVARFILAASEYQDAWDAVYGSWLPQSGYQPDDRPCFELYPSEGGQAPDSRHVVDICVPVRPL